MIKVIKSIILFILLVFVIVQLTPKLNRLDSFYRSDIHFKLKEVSLNQGVYKICYYANPTDVICNNADQNQVALREEASEQFIDGRCTFASKFGTCRDLTLHLPKEKIELLTK